MVNINVELVVELPGSNLHAACLVKRPVKIVTTHDNTPTKKIFCEIFGESKKTSLFLHQQKI